MEPEKRPYTDDASAQAPLLGEEAEPSRARAQTQTASARWRALAFAGAMLLLLSGTSLLWPRRSGQLGTMTGASRLQRRLP